MENPLARMQRRIMEVIQQETARVMQGMLKGFLSPEKLKQMLKSMGFDPSELPGMMSRQPGFDPYQILGLDKSASDEEVKHRYRELINKLHPDKSGTPGTNFLFQMVMAAYEMIKMQRGWQ